MVEMFLRLCPMCKMRAKGQASRAAAAAAAAAAANADDDSSVSGAARATKRS